MTVVVTYNGVTISNARVDRLSTSVEYDDGDRGKAMARTTLTVTGTIGGSVPSDLSADTTAIQQSLLKPRANLSLVMGGENILNVVAPDHQGGPKPRRAEVNQFIGSRFAIVVFEVEVGLVECDGALTNVLSHNYSVTHSLDERFMTTRTIQGVVRVREGASEDNPDALRGLVTPQVPQGFHRTRMDFVAASDGNTLQYTIVDEEQYQTVPDGVTKISGNFAHRLTNQTQWFNSLSVDVEAPKTTAQVDALQVAFDIALSRFDFTSEIIVDLQIQESLYENRVQLQIVTMIAEAMDNSGFPLDSQMFQPLPTSATSTDLGPYGSAMLAAAKIAFYDACDGVDASPSGSLEDQTESSSGPTVTTAETPASNLSPESRADSQSPGHLSNPYTLYEEELSYRQHNGTVILPSSKTTEAGEVYQIHNPWARLIQTGRAIRRNAQPDIPGPNFCEDGVVRMHWIQQHSPEFAEDKQQFYYSASWRYEIDVPFESGDFTTTDTGDYVDHRPDGYCIPENPMTTDTTDTSGSAPYRNVPASG